MAVTTRLQELYEIYPAEPGATMPIGIRVDNWLYGSVSGIDPVSGQFEGDMPKQARRATEALRQVLDAGGMQSVNVNRVKVYRSREDPRYFGSLQAMFGATVSNKMASFRVETAPKNLAPGQQVRIDFTAVTSQGEWTARMVAPQVFMPPDAVRIGPVLWTPCVTAARIPDGAIPGGIEAQIPGAFDNLERLLEREGVGIGQVLRIAGYMRDLKDKDLLNDEMVRRFPEWSQKPVHKYVPAGLPPGVEFALQAIAVEGGERRILEIEGIKHNDPISLGAQVGNVFVSSRVQARLEPSAREQAARLIESHARRLIEHIGGSLDDVTQMVWGIGNPAFEADVREACARHWAPERMPRLDVMLADFPHSPLPRLELFGLVGSQMKGSG